MRGVLMFLVAVVLGGSLAWAEADRGVTEPGPTPRPDRSLAADRRIWEGGQGTVIQATDRVWVATGFALGNAIMVQTDDGLVIIDTTSNAESASKVLKELRTITRDPIKTIIYTHSHDDHAGGGRAFYEPGCQVIAQEGWLVKRARDTDWLGPRIMRARALQGGLPIPRGFVAPGIFGDPVEPTITFDSSYRFTQGGVGFELQHAPSESFDHLLVWVPQWRVAFIGDAFYRNFPNLASPMIPCRDVRAWIAALDRIIGLEPEVVVPSHGEPLKGAATVRETLSNYRDAIAHVFGETIRGINQWQTVDQIAHSVKLPPRLAELPYLREGYGTVQGSVRGIFQCNTGWLDDNPAHADPAPPGARAVELVGLAGGADRVLERARTLHAAGDHQLAMELADVVLEVAPGNREAHLLKAACCEALVQASSSINWRGFYRAGAALERTAAGEPLPNTGFVLVPVHP